MTREEAIKWIDDRMCFGRGTFTEHHPPNIDECWQAGMMAIEALKDRPKGEWEELLPNTYYCTNCDRCVVTSKKEIKKYNFCPNCGADMRSEK